MLKTYLEQLCQNQDLSAEQMRIAMHAILADAHPYQTAALLALLHAKGESATEVYAALQYMQSVMTPVSISKPVIDIVGTGGDGAHTVNISTAASLIVASCGVAVAKHGNRAFSSRCGSADVLEALGVPTTLKAKQAQQSLHQHNYTFLFAPNFHPTLQKVKTIRKQLGIRTLFNLLGPLLNPCQPSYYLLGVAQEKLLPLYADILQQLPVKRAMVVHCCGLDELSTLGPTKAIEIKADQSQALTIDPKQLGFNYCQLKDLQGGDAAYNQRAIIEVLAGKQGPLTDTITLNAAAALYITGNASSLSAAINTVKQHLDNKITLAFLSKLTAYYQQEMSADA